MKRDELLRTIRESIAAELELEEASLDENASLRHDYGLESVAAVNIVLALEAILNRAIDIRKFAHVDTIAQLAEVVSGYDDFE